MIWTRNGSSVTESIDIPARLVRDLAAVARLTERRSPARTRLQLLVGTEVRKQMLPAGRTNPRSRAA